MGIKKHFFVSKIHFYSYFSRPQICIQIVSSPPGAEIFNFLSFACLSFFETNKQNRL